MENFILFIKERGIKTVYKVRPETINEYKKYLSEYQYQPGLYYTPLTQIEHLRGICSFFLYLYREKLIETDPAKHIILRQLYRELDEKYRAIVPLNSRRRQSIIDNPEIKELFSKFIQYGRSKGISEDTIKNYIPAVEKFYEFINKRNILDLRKITRHDIMDYQAWLAEQKTVTGEKYNINTVLNRLISLRSFFRYLARYDYLICDPSASIELPKRARGIPNTCMTERELQILLSQPNLLYPIEFRDRAIMEVLYSTGIRAKELAGLKMGDINFAQGLLRVDEPKGGKSKQRVIPIGQTACNYVKQYIDRTRPLFDKRSTVYLFLSESGRKLARVCLSAIIRKYLFRSGIRKKITTHSFRVTCATHMIRHKAEISYVQQQLGHTNISTTQEYVRLVPRDLKEVHNRCHPREHIKID